MSATQATTRFTQITTRHGRKLLIEQAGAGQWAQITDRKGCPLGYIRGLANDAGTRAKEFEAQGRFSTRLFRTRKEGIEHIASQCS